ncbi:hypothetical protein H0H92_002633 [Tricholoma furcatifolium]|nr:hypothetical protein H0H92_002633 [Tricholoma furcatifolium]
MSTADIHDPNSGAYKKARRLFLKATKNRNPDLELDWSPFRAAEKKYKARFPPPDLSSVLDLATLDPNREQEIHKGVWRGSTTIQHRELPIAGRSSKIYAIPQIPGAVISAYWTLVCLVILPNFVPPEKQKELIQWSLCDQAKDNETNLDIHYVLPNNGLWNAWLELQEGSSKDVLIQPKATQDASVEQEQPGPRQLINNTPATPDNFSTISTTPKPPQAPSATVKPTPVSDLILRLRWANIGWFYHWGTKQYDFTKGKGPIDPRLRSICRDAVAAIDWKQVYGDFSGEWGENEADWSTWDETYEPDAGIVNFYQTKDTLMAHVDRSEVCATSPLVSISLGNAAVFLIGGLTRDSTPVPILLRSGDVVVMSGPECRRAYHGVPRILDDTLPPHLKDLGKDWEPYEAYMRSTRINVNSGSMVEIKRTDLPPIPSTSSLEDDRYRLIYSKSKVYVNPTAYARDNIPGFVALVKREAANPIYLLAWIPETLLTERGTTEWDKFVKIEENDAWDEQDDDGSIGVNLINGDTLPTLHFHDDESRSFTLASAAARPPVQATTSYPPPPSHSGKSWGGEDLLSRVRSYAHVMRSALESSLFLIDPSRADIEAHSTQIFSDDAVDDILAQSSFANSHSPVPAHRRPRPIMTSTPNPYSQRSSVLHRSLSSPPANPPASSQARIALLQSFSNITRATRHAAQNILSHPLAKPIVPHLPDPVRSLVNANGEWQWGSWVEKGGVGEFESARVYLARWARIVAEEGERARRQEAQALPSTSTEEETSSLGIFELLHSTSNLPTPKSSRDPDRPVDEVMWSKWFAEDGRPQVRIEEMKREVFRRGISTKGKLRQTIWPFILGVYEWDSTRAERLQKWEEKRNLYHQFKDQWCGVPEVFDRPDVIEERHRIDVDCRRTDRTQPLFSMPETKTHDRASDEKKRHQRYSSISPNIADIGSQSPTNEHIDRLAGILLTYNFYEKDLGYVQGMSDLCAPIYVVMDASEEMTFWCFVEVMHRMKQNFLRDQSGMKKQLLTLQQLIGAMDPELYKHLEKTDGLNLFFCFRWVLIAFKREFPFDEVLRLWEVLWTDYYSNDFVLFVALAVLESHRDMIMRYLVEYCNELSMTIELDTTLAQAEVLFLSFAQLVADIDRRKAEELPTPSTNSLRRRGTQLQSDNTSTITINMPTLSENLRELLSTGR